MSTISDIRESMTRQLYSNVQTFMDGIPNTTFVPSNQTESISSYISARDRIYLSYGTPESVLKPTISSQQRQILQNGIFDICKLQKTVPAPEGIDYTQPPVYTRIYVASRRQSLQRMEKCVCAWCK
jgi:hypothetical protein